MSDNIRIIATNQFDSSEIAVTPAVVETGKFSKDGVKDPRRSRVLRTTSTADQEIFASWTDNVLFSGINIGQHNLTAAASGRIRAYSDSAGTELLYDSSEFDMLYPAAFGTLTFGLTPLGAAISDFEYNNTPRWFGPVVCKSIRINLSDPLNPNGYLQIGRLIGGASIQPKVNMDWLYGLTPVDNSSQDRTSGGTLYTEREEGFHRLRFRLSWLDSADRELFVREMRRVGKSQQVYISLFPSRENAQEIDHQMIAKLVDDPTYSGRSSKNSDVSYIFEES